MRLTAILQFLHGGLIAHKSARRLLLLPNQLGEFCERRLVVYEQLVDLNIARDRDLHQC